MRYLVRALVLMLALAPGAGVSQDKKKYKILYITQSKGFKHGSVDRKKDAPLAPSEISVTDIAKTRSEEHTSELQSQSNLVCRLLLEKKKKKKKKHKQYKKQLI